MDILLNLTVGRVMGVLKYLYKYYRISLDDETEIESNSITNQRQIVEGHIAKIPELAEMPSVEVLDDGHTGTNFNRPGMNQLMEAVRRGEVACIVVKDLSRFGRKYLEVSKYLEQLFPYLGIRFIAIGDGYDSDNHKGTTPSLDVPVRNMLNALYSKTVSKNVKSAKRNLVKEGKHINAFAAYGYKKDPVDIHQIIIDEPAAKIVRRIFDLTCEGSTPKQIADTFNAEQVLTPSAYKKKNGSKIKCTGTTTSLWTNFNVINILRNEGYAGTLIGGKVEMGELGTGKRIYKSVDEWLRIPNAHPAIITQEIWETAVAKRGKYSERKNKPNKERILYKKVRCGHCNHVFKYRAGVNDNYYKCLTPRYTDEYNCVRERIYEAEIVKAVNAAVKAHVAIMHDMEKLATTFKKVATQGNAKAQGSIAEFNGEIEQLQSSKRQLYERYKRGSIDKVTYFKEREAVENKINERSLARESLNNRSNEQATALNAAQHFFHSFTRLSAEDEPSAEAVNALVESVIIYDKDRIEVKFAFADKLETALQSLRQLL